MKKTGRALMVLGTASHVGKSVLTAALCRIFKQDGYSVAPFKAQNMALNSAATPDGLEIGRAQAMQAEAAGVAPSVDMNPILLKPCADSRSQLVVRGRVVGELAAREYHSRTPELLGIVKESYGRLASAHDVVVLEGAGSPAEVNLVGSDIVNMRMARAAGAACLLVADIDRGGVFAALVGTMALLSPADRKRIRGFVVNRFRGDARLFTSGVTFLERRLRRPCLGVVPYLKDMGLDEEDSVALEARAAARWREDEGRRRPLRIAVVALPHLSNFTDFAPLSAEPCVAIAFVTRPSDVAAADVVILPGSKRTMYDLAWLGRRGLSASVHAHAARGGVVIGICGGLQMLGAEVSDPHGMEGGGKRRGLGLLGVRTTMGTEKVTVRARARLVPPQLFGRTVLAACHGYEIHLGTTDREPGTAALLRLRRDGAATDVDDGARSTDGRVLGTYLHGFFDADDFRHALLRGLRGLCSLSAPEVLLPYTAERERRFDRLAEHVRRALDIRTIQGWLR
jgi:adenosylcobyric acid synthase